MSRPRGHPEFRDLAFPVLQVVRWVRPRAPSFYNQVVVTDGEHGLVGCLPPNPSPNFMGCKIRVQEFTFLHDPDAWDTRPRSVSISKYQVIGGPRPILTGSWSLLEQSLTVPDKRGNQQNWLAILGGDAQCFPCVSHCPHAQL